MNKLKYGLLLILSMILFSVPVLAAKTYYLPSKVVREGVTELFSYDKYGHIIKYSKRRENQDNENWTFKYKYDKNGKRISGKAYWDGELYAKLTFDKNDYIKVEDRRGNCSKFKWDSKGYLEENSSFPSTKMKYYYYKSGKLKKSVEYFNGKVWESIYYDNSGLRSKNQPEKNGFKNVYEYNFNKNGLVKSKIITTTYKSEYSDKTRVDFYYSKIKTDAKTYYAFIDGRVNYRANGKL